jgi:predicted RND superfamily exporter protein
MGATGRERPDAHLEHHRNLRLIERLFEARLFRHRVGVLLLFLCATLFFGYHAARLRPDASFQKMVPTFHPYVANYLKYENELRPLGNVIRVVVENTRENIYTRRYLDTLKKITDEVFYIPGVDRGTMKSLWTPNVMWLEVTEEGLAAGQIIPQGYDASSGSIDQVRTNVARSGTIGSLVASDLRSAVVLAPLLEVDPRTGEKLDYGLLSQRLELVRAKYQSDDIAIHITGFAKIVGDLIHGARDIAFFFAITFLLTVAVLYGYSRCWRSTGVTILCCAIAVVWQMGIVRMLGFGLDPYSILVPFLTFAIGVSHAVQNVSMMAAERLKGSSNIEAARATFRLLFIPGTVALLCDAVGFSTLLVIRIAVIQELAISASIGVAVIILTKMFLLPVLMSYVGVSPSGLRRQERRAASSHRLAQAVSGFAEPKRAWLVVGAAAAILVGSHVMSRDLKIGDLDPGAPELRQGSRYNRDSAFIA